MGFTDDQINAAVKAKQTADTKVIAPAPQPQGMDLSSAVQQPQPQKPGFVRGMAEALVKPAVDFGKLVAGTGFEVARAADAKMGNKNAYDIKKGKANPFLSREEIQKNYSNPKDIITNVTKKTASAGSYFTPVGKGVGVVGKAVQGAKAGAQAGALTGFGQGESKDIEGMAIDAATGGIKGAAVGGAIGAAGGVAGKIKGGGDAARRGVVKPKVQASPFMAEEEKTIAKTLEKYGMKGSPEAQKQQMPIVFKSISANIKKKLASSKAEIKSDAVESVVDEALNENINYDPTIPSMQGARDKYIAQIMKGAKEKGLVGVFETKQNLGTQLSRAFDKTEKGMPLTEKEEVAMTVWKALDNIISTAEPGVKEMTVAQSHLFKAAPGILSQSNKATSFPIVGSIPGGTVVNRGKLATQDAIGRGMQAVGGIPEAIPPGVSDAAIKGGAILANGENPIPEQAPTEMPIDPTSGLPTTETAPTPDATGGGEPVFTSADGQWKTMADGKSYSMDDQWLWDEASEDWIENPDAGVDFTNEDQVIALMAQDLEATGGKNIPEIKSMYEIANVEKKAGKLSATQQKRVGAINQAEGIYNMVEQLALDAPTGFEGFFKAQAGKAPGVEGGSAQDLDRTTLALAKGLAGALANEVGVATDKDIDRWMGLMPKVTDTMDERKRVLERLREAMVLAREQVSTPEETSSVLTP